MHKQTDQQRKQRLNNVTKRNSTAATLKPSSRLPVTSSKPASKTDNPASMTTQSALFQQKEKSLFKPNTPILPRGKPAFGKETEKEKANTMQKFQDKLVQERKN